MTTTTLQATVTIPRKFLELFQIAAKDSHTSIRVGDKYAVATDGVVLARHEMDAGETLRLRDQGITEDTPTFIDREVAKRYLLAFKTLDVTVPVTVTVNFPDFNQVINENNGGFMQAYLRLGNIARIDRVLKKMYGKEYKDEGAQIRFFENRAPAHIRFKKTLFVLALVVDC